MPSGNWQEGVTYASRASRAGLRVDYHALRVDRPGITLALAASKRAARTRVTGILHPRFVAGIEQHVRNEVKAALRSHHHLHLVRVAARATRLHLLGDCLAQARAVPRAANSRVARVRVRAGIRA